MNSNTKHNIVDVSISIVNYHSSKMVVDLLSSIEKQTVGLSFEIIVVNNSPNDKGFYSLPEQFPNLNIKTIDLKENVGFSKANNVAFKNAVGRYFLVCNPDIYFQDNAIQSCLNFIETHKDYVACTVKFRYPDGRIQASAFHRQQGAHIFYGALPHIKSIFKKYYPTVISVKDGVDYQDVGVLCGAFIFVRAGVYENIHGFDESFFLYGEDWEISNRLFSQGKMALLNNNTVVHHHGGVSKKEFIENNDSLTPWSRKGLQMIISILLWQKKEWGNWAVLKLFFMIVLSLKLCLLGLILKGFPSCDRKNWIQYFKNTIVLTKEVLFMLLNKKKVYRTM